VQHANASAVISLQHPTGESCTLLVSKNNNKIRLQGTSYHALALPLQELTQRLHTCFAGMSLRLGLEEALPVAWYQDLVEDHFSLRHHRQQHLAELEQAATQVRSATDAKRDSFQRVLRFNAGFLLSALARKCTSFNKIINIPCLLAAEGHTEG
jgi:PTHB1 C-terminus